MELTRPRRAIIYTVTLTAFWLTVAYVTLFGLGSMSWVSTGANTGTGNRVREYGITRWFKVTEMDVMSAGGRGPAYTRTTEVNWPVLLFVVIGLILFAAALRAGHRKLVKQEPLVGRCDECGYDLRAATGAQCPECGCDISATSAPAA